MKKEKRSHRQSEEEEEEELVVVVVEEEVEGRQGSGEAGVLSGRERYTHAQNHARTHASVTPTHAQRTHTQTNTQS